MVSGISDKLSSLSSSAGDIFDEVYDTLSSLPSDMLEIGKNLVEGLIDGIDNMTDWAIDKITSFGDEITDGLCEFFGIQSPSKLYRDEIGKYLAEGIGEGFTDEMDTVSQEMQDSIPTSFDTDYDGVISSTGGVDTTLLVRAFKEALSEMKVELDDREIGQFIDKTVTQAIYQ
jgi:phage-related protein